MGKDSGREQDQPSLPVTSLVVGIFEKRDSRFVLRMCMRGEQANIFVNDFTVLCAYSQATCVHVFWQNRTQRRTNYMYVHVLSLNHSQVFSPQLSLRLRN